MKALTENQDYWVENGTAYVRTLASAAAFVGVSGRQIQRWGEEGCPGVMPGRYCPSAIVAWASVRKWSGAKLPEGIE